MPRAELYDSEHQHLRFDYTQQADDFFHRNPDPDSHPDPDLPTDEDERIIETILPHPGNLP